jgi:hypothetical protein
VIERELDRTIGAIAVVGEKQARLGPGAAQALKLRSSTQHYGGEQFINAQFSSQTRFSKRALDSSESST